jgi:hypothetical protein
MTKMISDETAVTAMYVFETIQWMLKNEPADHPVHAWREDRGIVDTRYQCVDMAEQIDTVWDSFKDNELDGIDFEEHFVPTMLELMDFSSADLNTAPKFKGGLEAAIAYAKEDAELALGAPTP